MAKATVLFDTSVPPERPNLQSVSHSPNKARSAVAKGSAVDGAPAATKANPRRIKSKSALPTRPSSGAASDRAEGSSDAKRQEAPAAAPDSASPGLSKSASSFLGRSRHEPRPWAKEKPITTDHPTSAEQREPKGWTLSHILSKAKLTFAMSKVFAPHVSLADPNRVRVGVRLRPFNEAELKRGEKDKAREYLQTIGSQVKITNPKPQPGHEARVDEFAFDSLYSLDDSTAKVFKDLAAPLVGLLVEGFNGTIFAYGQTGSGKTHSMMGSASDPGLTPRVVQDLFEQLSKLEAGAEWSVKVSYLQIYREVLHDLLTGAKVDKASATDRDVSKDLKIRRDPQKGIYVENIIEQQLDSATGLASVIERGNKRRATAATLMNAESSRSHAVVILILERHDPPTAKRKGRTFRAKLNLVDLAGSERVLKSGATGDTLKEAIAINQSLSMLGTVINALTDVRTNCSHIPYRSSKLTYLLEESLGGNSHTAMLAACSPAPRNYFETLSTLQYAVRAKMIQLKPKANYDVDKEAPEDPDAAADGDADKRKGFALHYLPRYVRQYDEKHAKDETFGVSPLALLSTRSAPSARAVSL